MNGMSKHISANEHLLPPIPILLHFIIEQFSFRRHEARVCQGIGKQACTHTYSIITWSRWVKCTFCRIRKWKSQRNRMVFTPFSTLTHSTISAIHRMNIVGRYFYFFLLVYSQLAQLYGFVLFYFRLYLILFRMLFYNNTDICIVCERDLK